MPLIPGQPGPLPPFLPQLDKPAQPAGFALPFDPAHTAQAAASIDLTAHADNTRVTPTGKATQLHTFVDEKALPPPTPAAEQKHQAQQAAIEKLKTMKPSELHKLGVKDPSAFFKALLPAALESEHKYGVPAVMTLVQAAVESDFARSPVGGYNLFGIKGEGPAGSVKTETREVIKGKNHHVRQPFAKYHNFYEAASAHGQVYTNGYYDKAMNQYAKDHDVMKFIDNIAPIYATDPHYAKVLKARIAEYGLLDLIAKNR